MDSGQEVEKDQHAYGFGTHLQINGVSMQRELFRHLLDQGGVTHLHRRGTLLDLKIGG